MLTTRTITAGDTGTIALYPRIWLCQHFNLFSQELSNIEYYIEEDIGNNSAWNYRYFLKSKILTEATLHEELKYKINFGE
jgi:hypothetical protein